MTVLSLQTSPPQTWPLMIGFRGTKPDDAGVLKALTYLKEGLIEGVLFFAYNIIDPLQIKELTQAFKEASPHMPPLLAVDQEGGKVQRLSDQNGFLSFPSALEIAGSHSVSEAHAVYQQMAQQTHEAGFNYVFGPVVDLHDEGSPIIGKLGRSYGPRPETVCEYARAFIDAHRQVGVLTCLKHYPGHGLASGDTHQGCVDVTSSFQHKERSPFKTLMASGHAESVMSSHLYHQQWDRHFPVSLSETIIPHYLRQDDQYQGVVVTDDLHMGAIGKYFFFESTLVQALRAQNDLLIFSSHPAANGGVKDFDPKASLPEQLPNSLQRFLSKGLITQEALQKAHERVQRLRQRL